MTANDYERLEAWFEQYMIEDYTTEELAEWASENVPAWDYMKDETKEAILMDYEAFRHGLDDQDVMREYLDDEIPVDEGFDDDITEPEPEEHVGFFTRVGQRIRRFLGRDF